MSIWGRLLNLLLCAGGALRRRAAPSAGVCSSLVLLLASRSPPPCRYLLEKYTLLEQDNKREDCPTWAQSQGHGAESGADELFSSPTQYLSPALQGGQATRASSQHLQLGGLALLLPAARLREGGVLLASGGPESRPLGRAQLVGWDLHIKGKSASCASLSSRAGQRFAQSGRKVHSTPEVDSAF